MRSSTSSFDIGARTDRGRQRSNNQDTIGRADQWAEQGNALDREVRERYGRLYIVADGVGGNADGADASRMVVDQVMQLFYRGITQDGASIPLPEVPEDRLRTAIEHVTSAIHGEAQRRSNNMASTIVAALIHNDRLTVANVGDSPAFLIRPNQSPKQLTKAHIRQEADGGKSLAQAMGDPQVSVTLFSLPFLEGDSIVLCSDGLTDLVQPAEIAEVVQRQSASDATQTLIDMANRRGGHDNISTIVVRNGPPQPSVAVAPRNKQSPNMLIGIGIVLVIALLVALIVLVPRFLPSLPGNTTDSTTPNAVQTVAVGGNNGNGRNNPVPGQPTATLSSAPIPTATHTILPTATQSSHTAQPIRIKPTTAVSGTVGMTATAIISFTATPEPTSTPTATPDPRPIVPALVGMRGDDAEAQLKAAGIASRVEEVTGNGYEVPVDVVAETDPAAGTHLNQGDVVILKVKKNKPQSAPAAPAAPVAPPPPPKLPEGG